MWEGYRRMIYEDNYILFASVIGIVESITGFNCFNLLNTMGAQITLQPLRFGFRRIISFT